MKILGKILVWFLLTVGILTLVGSVDIQITHDQTTENGIDDYYYAEDINEVFYYGGILLIGSGIVVDILYSNWLFDFHKIERKNLKGDM